MPKSPTDWFKATILLLLIALVAFGFSQRQAIEDWIKLIGYSPPAAISDLVSEDTMTPSARHLFYINQPKLENKASFRNDCPNNSEKTIILGCYKGDESGIYLLKVSDPRLAGVEQVTAAHEMLHAAYGRLSSSEKAKVDGWLEAYFKTLTDQRLIDTINDYRQTEPHQLLDEMHSIFGSEVANLPPQLTNYYKRYFTDRSKVTNYAASYKSTFVKLKQQLADYDAELKSLKAEINSGESTTRALAQRLRAEQNQLNFYRSSGNASAYNSAVPGYNADVDSYNQLARTIEAEVSRYNQTVDARNKLAVTINNLGQELDANVKTIKPAG